MHLAGVHMHAKTPRTIMAGAFRAAWMRLFGSIEGEIDLRFQLRLVFVPVAVYFQQRLPALASGGRDGRTQRVVRAAKPGVRTPVDAIRVFVQRQGPARQRRYGAVVA